MINARDTMRSLTGHGFSSDVMIILTMAMEEPGSRLWEMEVFVITCINPDNVDCQIPVPLYLSFLNKLNWYDTSLNGSVFRLNIYLDIRN